MKEDIQWLVEKPTLKIAKKLFKRRNPNIKFNVSWKIKPTWDNNCLHYWSSVTFKSKGYKNLTMTLVSDRHKTAIF